MPARVRAPELAGRGGWIGTEGELSMTALRGRVVVLFFLRFSSVACLQGIEKLRPLARLFAEELVVVGVHCPGFAHETDHAAVVSGVARHRVHHPVIDDPDLTTAQAYGVGGWPTLVVVDPLGSVVETLAGDWSTTALERSVADLVARHEEDGTLRPEPPARHREVLPVPLAYPSGVAVSPDGRRLAISDISYDQVVVCTTEGLVLQVHTGFSNPHGVRFDDAGRVVVCDTAAGRVVRSDGEVLADAMSSPWDLVADRDGSWVVTEPGRHRILRVRPGELRARVAAGTGGEGTADGLAAKAEMAQPAGVVRVGAGIAFVDAEVGALRLVGDDQQVSTLATDGLEHPLALAGDGGDRVYVADTYNSALKVWEGGAWRTLPVEGLDEPGGLDLLPDGRLVVADTNHHRVVFADPVTGHLQPLELDDTWTHATEGEPVAVSRGAAFEVAWGVELEGEELEGARRAPVTVTVAASPAWLLASAVGPLRCAERRGTVALRAGEPGWGMLVVEVSTDVRQGTRRRLRRTHRYRYALEVR